MRLTDAALERLADERERKQRRAYALELAINSAPPDKCFSLVDTMTRAVAYLDFLAGEGDFAPIAKPTYH